MKSTRKKHIVLFFSLISLSFIFSQCAKENPEVIAFLDEAETKLFTYDDITYITDKAILASTIVGTGKYTYDTTTLAAFVTEQDYPEDECLAQGGTWTETSSGTGTSRINGFVPTLGSCRYLCPDCNTIIDSTEILSTALNLFITAVENLNTELDSLDDLSDGEYAVKISIAGIETTEGLSLEDTVIMIPDTSGNSDFAAFIKDQDFQTLNPQGFIVVDSLNSINVDLHYNFLIDEEEDIRLIGSFQGVIDTTAVE